MTTERCDSNLFSSVSNQRASNANEVLSRLSSGFDLREQLRAAIGTARSPVIWLERVLQAATEGAKLALIEGVHLDGKQRTRPSIREQIIWLAGERHVCPGVADLGGFECFYG